MKYHIKPDWLVITCTPEEQAILQAMRDEDPQRFDTDDFMYDLLEKLQTDDCFRWVDSRHTGDLTDAPMLAIVGDEEIGFYEDGAGMYPGGFWDDHPRVQPILYRWAFMNYALTSPQQDLLEKGKCLWQGGSFVEREGQMFLAYNEREFSCRAFPLV